MVIQWEEPDTPNGQVIVSAAAAAAAIFLCFYSSLFPLRKRLTEMSRSRKTGSFDGRHSNSLSTILNVAGAV